MAINFCALMIVVVVVPMLVYTLEKGKFQKQGPKFYHSAQVFLMKFGKTFLFFG
jgi:hypothetical protein